MASSLEMRINEDVRKTLGVTELRVFRNSRDIPYAVVGHNLNASLVTDKWIGGFESVEQFRDVLEYICELFETNNYRFWLADLRLLNTSFAHSDDWLASFVFPRVVAGGLVREAVVLPVSRFEPEDFDVFGSGTSALSRIPDNRISGFTDIDEAKAWLFQASEN